MSVTSSCETAVQNADWPLTHSFLALPDAATIMRLRGGGRCASKPGGDVGVEQPATQSKPVLKPMSESMIKLPSHKDSFACEASPLFKEYLGLLGESLGAPAPIGEITSTDALLVIDMQRDFVPKSAANADGGRFGVAEGDHIAPG